MVIAYLYPERLIRQSFDYRLDYQIEQLRRQWVALLHSSAQFNADKFIDRFDFGSAPFVHAFDQSRYVFISYGTVSNAFEMSTIVATPPSHVFILTMASLRIIVLCLQPSSNVKTFCLVSCVILALIFCLSGLRKHGTAWIQP